MRADRLVSLVLLLRQQGRMTASALAAELEVSPRTVQRDIDALSTAGVPVYVDRGRYGGFSLLPGFRTELTGLSDDEALALLAVGTTRGARMLGFGAALSAAMRKVVDALPEGQRADIDAASQRLLLEPDADLLSRTLTSDAVDPSVLGPVRSAVLGGVRLRFEYAAPGREPRWHTVDPIGLVSVREQTYLLATRGGADRTYRLSRMRSAAALSEQAERAADVDLDALWADRRARFLADKRFVACVSTRASRREELLRNARALLAEEPSDDGGVRLTVVFDDLRHALWAVWQLDADAEALEPESLRAALRERTEALTARYARGA